MLKLYYAPNSCALTAHIALIDAGAAYETVRLDFAKQDQRKPGYLAINPKGRVPSLATDRGVLTEIPALLALLRNASEVSCSADGRSALPAFNSYLCSTCHVAHAHRMRGYRWADEPEALEAMKRKVPASVTQCFELIEHGMLQGPWVMGEAYTICDPYLFTLAQWLEADGVDLGKLPSARPPRAHGAACQRQTRDRGRIQRGENSGMTRP